MTSGFKMFFGATVFFVSSFAQAYAGVVIGGTRLIYDGARKEATISVINAEKNSPYLIQGWVENVRPSDTSKPAFIVTPPLFRLDAGKENMLRVLRTGGNLPSDRESLYWLSIKAIPATKKTDENQLLISVKSRLKLIYRPADIQGDPDQAWKKVNFTRKGNMLIASNPTPFYISFHTVKAGNQEVDLNDSATLAPMSSLSWKLPSGASEPVKWKVINDYGGITEEFSRMN
ncbi:TPA: fimbrial biogenesis chaperone [Enterobacter cloacae]